MSDKSSQKHIDYSVYLVTGRDLVPQGKDYYDTVEQAIKGGVTIVQVREKLCDTGEFLEIAQKTKDICKRYRIPLLINDRIDIALAVDADGVHLGQTDMPVSIARKLLPSGSIIGLSCNTSEHARKAVVDEVDYIGVGSVWDTQTKNLISPIVGVRGLGEILDCLIGSNVKAVAIGGIKSTNILHTLHGAVSSSSRILDGVAVVSDIMASSDAFHSAKKIADVVQLFQASPPPIFSLSPFFTYTVESVLKSAASLLPVIKEKGPLIHQITNNVVVNQSANATLALGASPIMATAPAEMQDLSKIIGALLINFGTISDLAGMLEAGSWANVNRKPIVFDPVGIGSSAYRQTSAKDLLNTWQASVIKGNPAEIGNLAGSDEVKSLGVDSIGSGFKDPATFVRNLARKERCIIVMTGPVDWVSDGHIAIRMSNGHPYLSQITGSGCMVGTCIATFCAAANYQASHETSREGRLVNGDMLVASVGGVLAVTIASEIAAIRSDVKGTGTFLQALIDELYHLMPESIYQKAKIEII